ncbi:MAG: hypothetical protein M3496_06845 [Pseudomonadota bacterium]|nr:hypothetical protein [Pseudomonadota bacterium]
MTPLKTLAAAAAIGLGLMAVAESASASGRYGHGHGHHHGTRFSFGFWGGPGYWGPGYWGPGYWGSSYWGRGYGYGYGGAGYWGPPAVVYAPALEPRVWIESDPAPAAPTPAPNSSTDPNAQQWWYWCVSSRGYYPYVSSCAEGWQRVPPQTGTR